MFYSRNIFYIIILISILYACSKKNENDLGLTTYESNKLYVFNVENKILPSNEVNTIFVNDTSAIIGTTEGLTIITGNRSYSFNSSNSGLVDNNINDIAIKEQEIWIATNKGLCLFKNNQWTTFNKSNSPLPIDKIRSIAFDLYGNLWIGTFSGGGLCKYFNGNWQVFTPYNSGLPNNSVADIFVDSYNFIWLATGGGLSKFDGQNQWQNFNPSNSNLPNPLIYCLDNDSKNNLWIGSNGGLTVFDGQVFNTYHQNNSPLPLNLVRTIEITHINDEDIIIAGTEGKGIAIFENNNWKTWNTQESSLQTGYITCLFVYKNSLYIGTKDRGLAMIDLFYLMNN
jgi:ligand-binding sensor domain-containing protein